MEMYKPRPLFTKSKRVSNIYDNVFRVSLVIAVGFVGFLLFKGM